MITLEDLVQAALNASPDVRRTALLVLRGETPGIPGGGQPSSGEEYLTLKDVAGRLGFAPCTLWRWKVPGHELGGRRRFRLSEVQAYLQTDGFKRRAAALRASRRRAKEDTASVGRSQKP